MSNEPDKSFFLFRYLFKPIEMVSLHCTKYSCYKARWPCCTAPELVAVKNRGIQKKPEILVLSLLRCCPSSSQTS